MKAPTFAPAYVGLFPILSEVARSHGYALAVHGSVVSDFDLVAIPWTEKAVDAETLVRAVASRMSYTMDTAITVDRLFHPPYTEQKPHGRRSWCIPLDCGSRLDLSVVPHRESTAAIENQVGNLAMFVKRMARVLGRDSTHEKLAERAFDYLRRNGLEGSILRKDQGSEQSGNTGEAPTTSDQEAGE